MPTRIQRRRAKGWRMPDGAVYVGRPTKWGNPFRIGGRFYIGDPQRHRGPFRFTWVELLDEQAPDGVFTRITTATEAVEFFRRLMDRNPAPGINELRGRDLVCWCPLDQPCHADVLLELANRDAP